MMKKTLKVLLVVFGYSIVYLPIFIITLLSFNKTSYTYEWTGFSFHWYKEIFINDNLREAIFRSLTIAVLSTIVATIAGTLIAIGINSLTKKNRVRMMVLNNIPVINPDIVTGISLMLVFSLLPLSFGMTTMLLAHIFFSIPFVVLTVLPKLKELDPNLFEAALDLGCTHIEGIYKVILPSIKTSIIAGALIAFTMSIDDFVISYFTTGDGYNNFSIWLYSALKVRSVNPGAYAYNTLIVFITIGVLGYINLRNRKTIKRRK
ncbi:Inner membrane ABC transporter permease protein YdcV [Candidatus Izimaplasma bacterium HR1]|uniref:ABC transporter permease n=1 Tax=Candidatus Izimoplasma sp. HR1 TaxID=1541959 RepID=UPI0004F8D396|nr:Inner membrane ABC transporter permease protein YdcV [Candidatus Izimaplasma bacterium HR1]